jgi:ligand-binding sensor domain-containing protein
MMTKPGLILTALICFLAIGCTLGGGRKATPSPSAGDRPPPTKMPARSSGATPLLAPSPTAPSLPPASPIMPLTRPPTLISATLETVDSLSVAGTWHNYPFPIDLGMVKATAVDGQGRVWLGATTGLLMFDPQTQTWTSYTTAHGLLDNWINALLLEGDTLWIGTALGLSVLTPTEWRHYTTADGLPGGPVQGIVADQAGRKWAATAEGLARFDGHGWTPISPAPLTLKIEALTITPNNQLWIASADSVSRFDGQGWQTYPATADRQWLYINRLAASPQGQIWVSFGACFLTPEDCSSAGLRRFDGRGWQSYLTSQGHYNSAGDMIYGLNFDPNGGVWAGLGGRVAHFDGQTWTEHFSSDGWLDGTVQAVLFPPDAVRAIVTHTGLSYLRLHPHEPRAREIEGRIWTTYTVADGLIDNTVRAIAIGDEGVLWFGTEAGISRFDGQTWTNYTTADGLSHNRVAALAIDQTGQVWAGTGFGEACADGDTGCMGGGGLHRFDGQAWQGYGREDGLLGNLVTVLAVDQANRLWIGTDAGLNMLADGRWHSYQTIGGLADNFVTALAVGEPGQLWVGTRRGGLSRFDGQTWVDYLPVDYNDVGGDNGIAALAYHQGTLWVGLGGFLNFSSVRTFDGATWQSYGIEEGVLGYGVSALAIDQLGRAWVGSTGGLNEFSAPIWTYNTTNGLIRDTVLAIAIDAQNQKWIGTSGGVQKLVWGTP